MTLDPFDIIWGLYRDMNRAEWDHEKRLALEILMRSAKHTEPQLFNPRRYDPHSSVPVEGVCEYLEVSEAEHTARVIAWKAENSHWVRT